MRRVVVAVVVCNVVYVLYVMLWSSSDQPTPRAYHPPHSGCMTKRLSLPDDIVIRDPGFSSMGTNYYRPTDAGRAQIQYPYRLRLQACADLKAPAFATAFDLGEDYSPGSYAAYVTGHRTRTKDNHVAIVVRGSLTEDSGRYEALEVLVRSVARRKEYDLFFVYDVTQQGANSEALELLRETYPVVFGHGSRVTIRGINPNTLITKCLHCLGRQSGFGSGFGYPLGWAFGPELISPLFFGCRPGYKNISLLGRRGGYDLFWLMEIDVVNTGADPVTEFFTLCDRENMDHRTGAGLDLPIDLITPYPLHLVKREGLAAPVNSIDDAVPFSFHNLIVIQRVSRRLLHKYWKNAIECGLGGYCEVGLPSLCGMWKNCTASYLRPEYNANMQWQPAPHHDTMFKNALSVREGREHTVVRDRGLDVSPYGRWIHKSHGYSATHKQALLRALDNSSSQLFQPDT